MVTLIQEYITESAKKFPHKTAVYINDERISFLELEEQSNQLARFLKAKGTKQGDRIAFCLHKSIYSVMSVASIVKADAIYVPLNAQAPFARLQQMTEDSTPKFILCDNRTYDFVKSLGNIVNLDEAASDIANESKEKLIYENNTHDIAYILYTSGSTGKPKGVMIRHSNIINATDWACEELGITEHDRMSQHPPLHFDLSTFDLYCAFKAGTSLYLIPEGMALFPSSLLTFIERTELTIWNSVPSVMVQMFMTGIVKPNRLPKLKKIFFNGEAFPTKFLAAWMQSYPDKVFVNMYGPTETTVQCMFYPIREVPRDMTKSVPIGKACRNVEVVAVQEDGTRADINQIGELYISGLGIGAGYWNNPEKTAISFIPHPFDPEKGTTYRTGDLVILRENGNYDFIGRKDNQIKIRGNRIELGDVEAALYALPYIKEAAAMAIPDQETGGNKLIAFVNVEKGDEERSLKDDIAKIIPGYMIPDEIRVCHLPQTSTGKIDRVMLKKLYERKD